ncbi:hypothetical protein Mp_3g06950 [Marchantia polymorpha subsp. ruderalis]|uniref:Uncharacterized protein n=2 Tax=Marchantia polymorpha TaxID=3197 RepID=A0AAF6AY63_MARPO|nr:hypothetical protein MARPO_0006s0169 [Marchantia polymorpha]BBN04697.1 hypothetical protein Mp_3g06950 [Marchantia polymorpha subsp. ruderalis]|eukprot:PTQ48142.1 hypothetical protein MARPO_0006s0169 [Marchantia polymorpha]
MVMRRNRDLAIEFFCPGGTRCGTERRSSPRGQTEMWRGSTASVGLIGSNSKVLVIPGRANFAEVGCVTFTCVRRPAVELSTSRWFAAKFLFSSFTAL